MSRKILIVLGGIALLLTVVITAMFGTGLIEVVSVEQAYKQQQQEIKILAKLEETNQLAMERQLGSMTLEDAVALMKKDTVTLADLDKIRILIENKHYPQALKAHLWFHEKSKSSAAMAGVRLSFALSSWMELGKKYSPALEALKGLRDENTTLLQSGSGNFNNFHDFFAINKALDENATTLDLFLDLYQQSPEQVGMYYHVIESLLIEAGRFDIVQKFIGDPVVKYENLRFFRETSVSHAKSSNDGNTPFLLESADKQFIKDVLSLIEVCLKIDEENAAREIQRRALSYFENADIRAALE